MAKEMNVDHDLVVIGAGSCLPMFSQSHRVPICSIAARSRVRYKRKNADMD